jgi:hypothetical protein
MPTAPKVKLKFKVAPHIVEDLGLNLYTSLPRVLVEYVANAYDADASYANVVLDKDAIEQARLEMKKQFELEQVQKKASDQDISPLESRTLPAHFTITIEDDGHGMSREDLDNKFLFAGRRRRREEPELRGRTPEKKRFLMGRKGLGKLAGFGVAKLITVITRKKGERHATKIVLDYDQLAIKRATHEIDIDQEEMLGDGGGIAESGTTIILSCLLYDPLRSRIQTVDKGITEHFALIDPDDFAIWLNGTVVETKVPTFAFAWPEPNSVDSHDFVTKTLPLEDGGEIAFQYRFRFTGENEALPAAQRGVRVYANKRLAAAPSLLNANTNMHGFRMTDYLDGVVHADFIANQEADYIATDRQTLRWESPLLSGMYDFLSAEIKEACKQYQKLREGMAPNIVKNDLFTQNEVCQLGFSKKDERMAYRIAVILKNACKQGIDDPMYKEKLPILLRGIGHGNILAAISELADEDNPDLQNVAIEVARLAKDELDQFVGSVKVRLKAIEALKKIVRAVDFKEKQNEKVVQKLFEDAPWLIDPTYTQFLTADKSVNVLFDLLAKELEIDNYAPGDAERNDDRPDLTFLLGSTSLDRLVIVELKSANLHLEEKHRTQLGYYMETAEAWLADRGHAGIQVHGHLIGSKAPPNVRGRGIVALNRAIKQAGPDADWTVRDYLEVLEHTEAAHKELLAIQRSAEEKDRDEAVADT